MDGFVIKENAMRVFTVSAQALSVIRRDYNGRIVIEVSRVQCRHELSNRSIRGGYSAIVRRVIWCMRIV